MGPLSSNQTSAETEVPKPNKIWAFLWRCGLVATSLLVASLLWKCGSGLYDSIRLSKASVRRFHEQLNNGEYPQILDESSGLVRDWRSRDDDLPDYDDAVRFFTAIHTKLGNATSEKMMGIDLKTLAQSGGDVIVVYYHSTFERGSAEETFDWFRSRKGLQLEHLNLYSTPPVLITISKTKD
jgi:hypothetical protein